jgi:hypothetical protein
MEFSIDQLPPYEQISEPHIRDAAGAVSAARAALDEAKKAHTQAELELPASEYKDAELAAEARAAGKPEPKTRQHTVAHEKRIRDLAHELKTCEVMALTASDGLEDAIEQYGETYAAEIEQTCSDLAGEWRQLVEQQITLHAKLQQASLVRSRVIPGAPQHVGVAAVGVKPGQIGDKPEPVESDQSDTEPGVDLTGLDQMSVQDALAGSPTQEQVEARSREWDARHAR